MRPWRFAGSGMLTVAVSALVLNALWQPTADPRPALPAQPGFRQKLARLGEVETVIEGRLVLWSHDREKNAGGKTQFRPVVKIDGWDPIPGEDRSLILDRTRITGFRKDPESVEPPTAPEVEVHSLPPLYEVVAKEAHIPLEAEKLRASRDESRPWELLQPDVKLPAFFGREDARLTTSTLLLNASRQFLRGPEAFQLTNPGLEVHGFDIQVDALQQSFRFGEQRGQTKWQLTDPNGELYTGESDSGGSLLPPEQTQAEHYRFEVPAKELCWLKFPETADITGTLHCMGFSLDLEKQKQGWQPKRADIRGPSRWLAEDLAIFGQKAEAEWSTHQGLKSLRWTGPIRGFQRQRNPQGEAIGIQWFRADGGAEYRPEEDQLLLFGRAQQGGLGGANEAEVVHLNQGQVKARGQVFFSGEEGSGTSVALDPLPADGWALQGPALATTGLGPKGTLATTSLHYRPSDTSRLRQGFHFQSLKAGQSISLQGRELDFSETDTGLQRMNAREQLIFQHGSSRFEAETLLALGDDFTELRGRPVIGKVVEQDRVLDLQANQVTQQKDLFLLEGSPQVGLDASMLGIGEGRMILNAGMGRMNQQTREIQLNRNVKISGAIQGSGDKLIWNPETGLLLQARLGQCQLSTGSHRETAVNLRAGTIQVDPEGRTQLEEDASIVVHLQEKPDNSEPEAQESTQDLLEFSSKVELTGQEGEISAGQGEVRKGAELTSGKLKGKAKTISWKGSSGPELQFHLSQRASLTTSFGEARGEEIYLLPGTKSIRVEGTKNVPAIFEAQSGRRYEGDWIQVDLENRLVSAGKGQLLSPSPSAQVEDESL